MLQEKNQEKSLVPKFRVLKTAPISRCAHNLIFRYGDNLDLQRAAIPTFFHFVQLKTVFAQKIWLIQLFLGSFFPFYRRMNNNCNCCEHEENSVYSMLSMNPDNGRVYCTTFAVFCTKTLLSIAHQFGCVSQCGKYKLAFILCFHVLLYIVIWRRRLAAAQITNLYFLVFYNLWVIQDDSFFKDQYTEATRSCLV